MEETVQRSCASIAIKITQDGVSVEPYYGDANPDEATERRHVFDCGKSIIGLPLDYTVIDLETTGLSPYYDEIIELAAIRVRGGKPCETFQQLVNPQRHISDFISELTHITDEMVADAPPIWEALPGYLDFIGEDVIVGHNVGFDVRFVFNNAREHLNRPFPNDSINTVRIARKALSGFGPTNYRLDTLCDIYGIDGSNHHRALADCEQTYRLYEKMRGAFESEGQLLSLFVKHNSGKGHRCCRIDPRMIESQVPEEEIDKDNPFYGKTVVFTGALEKYPRVQAMQLVANLGGKCAGTVTKATDYLVLGCNDYCSTIKDGKRSNQKKAEEYARKGTGISIIDERTFYDLVSCGDD